MKKTSKRRPQTEIFKAWLYYNGVQDEPITFAQFRQHVWPEWISVFRHPVYRS